MGGLGVFALIVLVSLGATVLGGVVWLAKLPGKIAISRGHPQADAINVAGWLGIVTIIVWVLAVIWAHTRFGAENALASSPRLDELEQRLLTLEGRDAAAGDAS